MRIVGHFLAVLLALAFLIAGGTKLGGNEAHVDNFLRWEYPMWFMYLTGALEVLAALLVLIPVTRLAGSGLILALMVGAIGTHAINGELIGSVPAALLAAFALVAGLSRPRRTA